MHPLYNPDEDIPKDISMSACFYSTYNQEAVNNRQCPTEDFS